jgi:tRNA (guanine37-N1)-methyltransferase
MVLQYQPVQKAISSLRNKGRVVYLSPQGKVLTQSKLHELSNYDDLTLLCGRYEGIDERIFDDLIDEEVSIGNYVISGGEVPAMVLLEGIIRLLPGAVDDSESIKRDSFQNGLLDYPHYTRPDIIDGKKTPEVLIRGNHQEIEKWRKKNSLGATWGKRRELLKNVKLSEEDDKLLKEYIAEHEGNEN